jgi:C1A family cysteine protease
MGWDKAPNHLSNTAAQHKFVEAYRRLSTLEEMLDCLAAGRTFIFGIDVFEEFESAAAANTGMIPNPSPRSQNLGGHEIQGKGYDKLKQLLKFRNSWNNRWGDRGYGYLTFDYVRNHLLDAYCLDGIHPLQKAA